MYRPDEIPFLHRGCKYHHQRASDRYTFACAQQNEAHPTRSHGTHGPDRLGDGVSD